MGDLPSPINPPTGCVFHTRCWKAQDKCRTEAPVPVELRPKQLVACHFPEEGSLDSSAIDATRVQLAKQGS